MKYLLLIIIIVTVIISCRKTENRIQSVTKVGVWTIDSNYNKVPGTWEKKTGYTIKISGLTTSDSVVLQGSIPVTYTLSNLKIDSVSLDTDTLYCSSVKDTLPPDLCRLIFLQPLNNSFQQIRLEQPLNNSYNNNLYQIYNCHR